MAPRLHGTYAAQPFVETWEGREEELEADDAVQQRYRAAVERGEIDSIPIWAGEAVAIVTELDSAAGLVARSFGLPIGG